MLARRGQPGFEQMARPIKDLTGKTFGILKVERFAFLKGHHAYWRCRCECGTDKDIRQDTLLAGVTVSCSCRKISILKQRPQAMRSRIAKAASRARWQKK